jgi:hypothetical protein
VNKWGAGDGAAHRGHSYLSAHKEHSQINKNEVLFKFSIKTGKAMTRWFVGKARRGP